MVVAVLCPGNSRLGPGWRRPALLSAQHSCVTSSFCDVTYYDSGHDAPISPPQPVLLSLSLSFIFCGFTTRSCLPQSRIELAAGCLGQRQILITPLTLHINYGANQDPGQTRDFHAIIQSVVADNKLN